MAKTPPHSLVFVFCALIVNANIPDAFASSSTTTTFRPTKLVDGVCKKTSSYSFCVNSLYSDSRTADADGYTLCFIAVGLAYTNATDTQSHISQLLRKETGHEQQLRLQRCSRDYKKAASAFAMAYNDLDSETFFELDELAAKASAAANNCEAAFKGVPSPPLSSRNRDIVGLSQIVAIVGKLFTGGD